MEEINPWANQQTLDIQRLFSEFGIEPIDDILGMLPEVPYFMKRGIVIGQRDYTPIASCIHDRKPFHILTGFMPSGHPHLGHLMVIKEVVWHVRQGGNGYITIADREAHAVRDTSWEKCKEFGREYLACLYALGFEGKTYFQSRNDRLKDLAFESSVRVNFSELQSIYGFSQETSLGHMMSVITQVADILYPQVESFPAPTVVPVGIDQDPHIRLTRGVAHKLRMFTVEDRGDYISVRSKNAPSAALDAVHNRYPGSKKYEGHLDIPGSACTEVSAVVREIEILFGGFGFYSPSSTYHLFLPGLQGGKMSSSIPESTISFTEPDEIVKKKVMAALTGGRATLAEQREQGGEPERCPLFLLNLFHMVEDDQELEELQTKCRSGQLMCGQCKKETAERVLSFVHEMQEKMAAVEHLIEV
ncbi:MAG: tryptophan--tRNA ligase [Methanoregulaceae archaeon]|nr:tryptophan--tRNA ligase [Methanoregulaceae archaeon]